MSERWMNSAAKPAVSSSDAGISAISSRLRALTAQLRVRAPAATAVSDPIGGSLRDVSLPQAQPEPLGVVARAERVVGERPAPAGGHALERDTRAVVHGVQPDPERQVVGQPAIDGDDIAVRLVDPDEVHLARAQPQRDNHSYQGAEAEHPARRDEAAPAPAAGRRGVDLRLLERLRARA